MHFPATHPEISRDGLTAKYPRVFPDIDLLVYRVGETVEYDWIVAPGADASAIDVSFSGTRYERVGPDGDLLLGVAGGEVRHGKPFAYQEVDGRRVPVECAFNLSAYGHVGFTFGDYDRTRPLIIDPVLTFASGIGGSGIANGYFGQPRFNSDLGSGLALDGSGNIYIAGLAYSPDFPLVNPIPLSVTFPVYCCSCPSSFVAKLSPDGKTILYSTLLAACSSSAPALAADAAGNVYVAGTGGPFVQVGGGTVDASASHAFVAKVDTNGVLKAALTFSGSGVDAANSIQLGPDGKLFVAGTTSSPDFPVTTGALRSTIPSAQNLFLIRMDPSALAGNQPTAGSILYSALLGPGSSPTVAADAGGNAYVAASTTSTSWVPTAGVFQPQCWDASREPCADAIALKVNPTGNALGYMTYLGGSGTDTVGGLAVDSSGNAYIVGTTNSFDFPTTPGAYTTQFIGSSITPLPFAVKLSADASHLVYGAVLSIGYSTTATAIALDNAGNMWLGGLASDSGAELYPVPLNTGFQRSLFNTICAYYTPSGEVPASVGYCPQSGYLAELDPTGSQLLWATYLGGGNVNAMKSSDLLPSPALNSIVLDTSGNILVTGNQLAIRNTVPSPSKTNSASVVKIAPGGTSLGYIYVQSAAGFESGLPEPGGLAALYIQGTQTNGTTVAPGLPLPTQLAGFAVFVDGVAAPLIAVVGGSTTQINFQVPVELAQPQAHIVEVQYAGQSGFVIPQQAAPGIFTLGTGAGVIQHAADYSLVTVQNPVVRGEIIIIYATGLGAVSSPVASGLGATGADPISPTACNQVTTNAGTVLYAGLTPGFPGLYQVNVHVSQYLPPGTNYFYLQSQGCWVANAPQSVTQSNSVGVYVP